MAWVRDVMHLKPSGMVFSLLYIFHYTIYLQLEMSQSGAAGMGGSRCVASRALGVFFLLFVITRLTMCTATMNNSD